MGSNYGNRVNPDSCGPEQSNDLGLSVEDMEFLSQNSKQVEYAPGETVIKQGTFAAHVFYLKKGLVKVILESSNSKRVALKLLASGSFFGLPFLHTEYFHFGAETLKGSVICQIRKEPFLRLIERNLEANRFMLDWYSRQYQDLFNRLEVSSTRNNHGKLAALLYALCDDIYTREQAFDFLTRRDLAELAFISKESTNKILKEFENDRIIAITPQGIQVIKPDLLRRLSMIG